MACRVMLQQDSKNTVPRVEDWELGHEAQKLIDGKRDDAEHEMAHDFSVATHAYHSAAKFVFDPRINALDGGALVVADVLSQGVAKPLAPPFLSFELLL